MLNLILANASNLFWMPERSDSTVAGDVDGLFYFIYYLSLFFFLLITFLLIAFIIKYRHREGQKPHEPAAGHSTALELTWTIIPTILLLVVFLAPNGLAGLVRQLGSLTKRVYSRPIPVEARVTPSRRDA